MRFHPGAALICGAVGAFAAGCAGPGGGGEGAAGAALIAVPDGKHLVDASVILHDVSLFFEMDRPLREGEAINLSREAGERYGAAFPGEPPGHRHRFAYEEGKFLVGPYRYQAPRGGLQILFVLREREGPFTFDFRGRRITVEREGRWKPALLYREVQEKRELTRPEPIPGRKTRRSSQTSRTTISRVVREEVQAGPHRLAVFPDSDVVEVNGKRVHAPAGSSIALDRRGGFHASR